MELPHGLSPEQRTRREILFLEGCRTEVLVLTSTRLHARWSPALSEALAACARRGLRVRVLLEDGAGKSAAATELRRAGIDVRHAPRPLSWPFRPVPLVSELWAFDRSEAVAMNERILAGRPEPTLRAEFLLGREATRGIASYFDRRWDTEGRPLSLSIRHKEYAFHGGPQAELSFYEVLLDAQGEIILSVPSGRVSRRVEAALHTALRAGIRVTLYTNADRDDAPGLRRLRRLSTAGAVVKICGRRLASELAVLDKSVVYLGSLPMSQRFWARTPKNVFVLKDAPKARAVLDTLEAQVSVEIAGAAPTLAFR